MTAVPKLTFNKNEVSGDVEFPDGWFDNLKETSDYMWRLDVLSDWISVLSKRYKDLERELDVAQLRKKMILEVAERLEQTLGEPVETFILRHSPEGTKQ